MSGFAYPDYCILQFARSPASAEVKTRLGAALKLEERLALHGAMVRQVAVQACGTRLAPLQLWVDGPLKHPLLERLSRELEISLHSQPEGNLGQRLLHAAAHAVSRFTAAILVGSDCPFLNETYLRRAAQALEQHDAVVGPAVDGGYVLIGLKKVSPELFEDVNWGSGQVLATTIARLEALSWRYRLLPTLPDIDRPEDLGLLDDPALPDALRRFGRGVQLP